MKIRTEPMLGGAAFSFVILLIINIISLFMIMNAMQDIVGSIMATAFDPTASPTSAFGSSPLLSIMSCVSCIATLVAGIGAGVVYARQYAKIEPITGSLLGGGAASGALGFFLSGIVLGIAAGLLVIPVMNQMSAMTPGGAFSSGETAGIGIVSSLLYSVCYGVFYALIGAILGLIGAAVGVPKSAKAA